MSTSPSYAPRSSRFGSEPPSVEDDVDVWRYAIVSCMPETTTTSHCALERFRLRDWNWDNKMWKIADRAFSVTLLHAWNQLSADVRYWGCCHLRTVWVRATMNDLEWESLETRCNNQRLTMFYRMQHNMMSITAADQLVPVQRSYSRRWYQVMTKCRPIKFLALCYYSVDADAVWKSSKIV